MADAEIDISLTGVLDADGKVVGVMPDFARDPAELVALYRGMVLTRTFDAKAIALQRTGRLGTFASSLGQEAVAVGVAAAMQPSDVLLPSFREHGAQLWRGVTLMELFLYWGGDERGNDFAGPREDFPICVPVGSHAPHAVGVALAFRLRGRKACRRLRLRRRRDLERRRRRSAEHGRGLEGAGRLRRQQQRLGDLGAGAKQTAPRPWRKRPIAAGIQASRSTATTSSPSARSMERALARARQGGGPTLIEALTYRLCDHTTADDASRYRNDAEVSRHWPAEPVARLRNYLTQAASGTRPRKKRCCRSAAVRSKQAADDYLATPPQAPAAIFDYIYAKHPPSSPSSARPPSSRRKVRA